jgi:ribose-phosphate pyrophosphokinase
MLDPVAPTRSGPLMFALGAARILGQQIAAHLGLEVAAHEERRFEDGERKLRPLVNVRDRDVYVLDSLYGAPPDSVHDKLCRLLWFSGALRDASAGRITAVVPYLCYSRKDAKTKARDPVATRYVALLLEAVGVDRVVTMDVHNPAAFQNAFRCPTENLEARTLFVAHFGPLLRDHEVTVVSPDPGGFKRADRFRSSLERVLGKSVAGGLMEKRRSGGVVSGNQLVGPVEGRAVVVLDDLISTGGTLARAAEACRGGGASAVFAAATHGLFTGDASTTLHRLLFDEVVVTDTVPLPESVAASRLGGSLVVLETASLLAKVIGLLHTGGSVTELFEP